MTAVLRLSRTHFPVTALGYGRRLGIWVQGCPLACTGCMARDTWEPTDGVDASVGDLIERWRACRALGADGITISGGEPLAQAEALAELLEALDSERAGAEIDVMVFTGYEESELDETQQRALTKADVVVTGRYRVAEPTTLIWRGSANQTMHLRTELARRRYASLVDYSPEHPPMQVRADEHGVWLVGVPRAGTLPTLERELRQSGIPVEQVSWRPPSTSAGQGR